MLGSATELINKDIDKAEQIQEEQNRMTNKCVRKHLDI